MTKFLISRFVIFGIPIIVMACLFFLRKKKEISSKYIEVLCILNITYSISQIIGFKLWIPVETVDTLTLYCFTFSLLKLMPKYSELLASFLTGVVGYVALAPLFGESFYYYFQWSLLVGCSYLFLRFDGNLSSDFAQFTKILVFIVSGLWVSLNGSLSLGQIVFGITMVEILHIFTNKMLKSENTNISLSIPLILIVLLEFLNYGF